MKRDESQQRHAHVARVYHYHLRAKIHDPIWRTFWWDMYEWAQSARRRYADSLQKGQGRLL